MRGIHTKTITDLEFHTVLQAVSQFCMTDVAKAKAIEIRPYQNKEALMDVLHQTSEYLSSFDNENTFPNHTFEDITPRLHFLAIEDSYLDAEEFKKMAELSKTANVLLLFLKKFQIIILNFLKNLKRLSLPKKLFKKSNKKSTNMLRSKTMLRLICRVFAK